jgi:CAAX protease family protein
MDANNQSHRERLVKPAHRLADPTGQLLAFVGAATVCLLCGIAAAAVLTGLFGYVRPDAAGALASGIITALLLGVSAWLFRQQGRSLADLGLPRNSARLRELGFGFLLSSTLFLGVVWAQSSVTGSAWEFQGAPGMVAAMRGLALVASMVLTEELLFRGVGLRALGGLVGQRHAVVLSALLFGGYHLVGSGDWAMGAVFRFSTAFLGGLLLGWTAVRSGGLSLPIGLHLGGNWVQASLAGFNVLAGADTSEPIQALWRIPITSADVRWLTAPDVLPRLPYLLAIPLAAAVTWQFLRSSHPNVRA